MLKYIYQYKATITYVGILLLLTVLFDLLSHDLFSSDFSPFSGFVGALLVFRNFAQREIGHGVILLMLLAGVLIHQVVTIENATTAAFLSGEFTDMLVYSTLRKTLIQRMFWSVAISSFVDSIVFLFMTHHLSWFSAALLTTTKVTIALGILLMWEFIRPFQRHIERQYKLPTKSSDS